MLSSLSIGVEKIDEEEGPGKKYVQFDIISKLSLEKLLPEDAILVMDSNMINEQDTEKE